VEAAVTKHHAAGLEHQSLEVVYGDSAFPRNAPGRALGEELLRAGRLCRGEQVARPLAPDARVRIPELGEQGGVIRQVRELVQQSLGPERDDRLL
jgi:hypothetical protein